MIQTFSNIGQLPEALPLRAASPVPWFFTGAWSDLPGTVAFTVFAQTKSEALAIARALSERFEMQAIRFLRQGPETAR